MPTIFKAFILLLGMFLVFVWLKPEHESVSPQVSAISESANDAIIIPKIQVNSAIVYVDSFDESAIQSALGQGVAHMKATAKPGENGNAYFVGGALDNFNRTVELVVGDDILVSRSNRQSLVYKVTDIKIVGAYDAVSSNANQRGKFLTIQTPYAGSMNMLYLVIAELK